MPLSELLPLAEIRSRVDRTAGRSPADGTAIVWLEVRHESICEGGRGRATAPGFERTILIRVREGGRVGECRTGSAEPDDLESALRLAIAASRVAPRPGGWERLGPGAAQAERPLPVLFDAELAALSPESATARLAPHLGRREMVEWDWAHGRVVIGGDLATAREAELTAHSLRVRCGRRPGSGSAEGAGRTVAELPLEAIFARARSVHAATGLADLPAGPGPAVLSAEASCALFEGLARAVAAWGIDNPWVATWGAALNAADLEWLDDPWAGGLPLPWDLLGRPRTPRPLLAGLEQPASALREEPVGRNLRLRSRLPATGEDLLSPASGGLWVGAVESVEAVPRGPGTLRWVGRGLRRVGEGGALGDPVPDAVFEVDPAPWLGSLCGCGTVEACRAAPDRLWGAVSAPALAFTRLPAGRALPI